VVKVYMGIPSTGNRADLQSYALRVIEKRFAGKVELVYPDKCITRIFHDFARNEVVEDFLKTDCEILWFLDSDVVPPEACLDLIVEHGDNWELAGCPYPVWMTPEKDKGPQIVYCVYKKTPLGLTASKVPHSGLEMVDGLATGCLFIKREVFDKLEQPYFEFKYDPKNRKMIEGEDLGFCRKVGNQGYKFLVNYELTCRHYKTVDLSDVNAYAIEYANKAVINYDASIRPVVEKLAKQVEQYKGRSKSGLILPP